MAGLLDLFSGRSSDLYGGALTPEQRGGMGNIGLLALAGKLGQLAGPSFSPVPDFGAAIGQAAGAYGASQEGAGTAALNAILTAQRGRKLEQELDYYKQLGPILGKLGGDWPGAGGGAGGGEGSGSSGSTGGGAAAPAGAGGGGADPSEADIIGRESGGKPYVGYGGVDLSNKPLNEFGFPIWEGRMGPAGISHAAGLYQFQPGTWATYAGPLGIKDFSPESQRKVYLAARAAEGARPWDASAGGGGRAAPAPTAAAPVGAGGLLAPTAPNPLSDAEPMVGIPRPAAQGAGAPVPAALAPYVGGTGEGPLAPSLWRKGYPGAPGQRADLGGADTVPGQGALEEPSGFAGRQLVAQLLARPPIDDVNQYRQVAGPGAADAAAPRAPLPTMGPAGIELPPMQGPLAAPAPAAAAPAAAGPGLLSPGMPAAPALPRVNPAFDAYARQLAVAAGLAKGAGLPDALSPLLEVFKGSPGYRAQQIIAEKGAAQPFEQAQTLFNKQVEVAGVGPIEAAKLPYALAQTYFKAEQDLRIAGPTAALQNFERIKADNAAKGIITTMGADGQIRLSIDPDAVKAVTGATITAPKQAEADIARETTRLQQEQAARYKTGPVQIMGPDGRPQTVTMSEYDYNLKQQQQNAARAAGAAPQLGDIVGTPVFTKFEEGLQTGGVDFFNKARVAADTAAKNIDWNNESIKLLDNGLYAGWGAPVALQFARIFNIGGKSEQEKIQNTQKFLLERGQQVAAQVKAQPGSASDKDVEFANRLSLGDITLDEGTIRQMLELYNKYNRKTVDDYNSAAAKIRPDVLGGLDLRVPVAPKLNPPDPETLRNAQDAIKRGAKPGPIRNKLRASGFDPEGL